MHGRSRMTIDPRIPPMPARSTSGFTDQADIDSCTKREAKREVLGESHERVSCILLRTACGAYLRGSEKGVVLCLTMFVVIDSWLVVFVRAWLVGVVAIYSVFLCCYMGMTANS